MSSAYLKCLEKQKLGSFSGLCSSNKETKNTHFVWVGVGVTTTMSHSSVLSAWGLLLTSIQQSFNQNEIKRNSNQVIRAVNWFGGFVRQNLAAESFWYWVVWSLVFWQTQQNHFPTVQLFQLPSTSLLPPFVLDSPRQNCGSPHIASLFSSPLRSWLALQL